MDFLNFVDRRAFVCMFFDGQSSVGMQIKYEDRFFKCKSETYYQKKQPKKRKYTISTELNTNGFFEIEREGFYERVFKALYLAKEIEIKNNQGFSERFYINHRDESWVKNVLYDQNIQKIISEIFDYKPVESLYLHERELFLELETKPDEDIPEEILNGLVKNMHRLCLELEKFPSSEKFYDKADYLSVVYVLSSLAIIGFSFIAWIFNPWFWMSDYCDLQGIFQGVANKAMLYFVFPFLGFVILLRGRRPDNNIWLLIFAVLTPLLYICLWHVVIPFANELHAKAEVSAYAFVEGKHVVRIKRSPDKYYLYLSNAQERGGCFEKVRVSVDIYRESNIGDRVVILVKWGLFDVPYVDEIKLVR